MIRPLSLLVVLCLPGVLLADEKAARAILDRAIEALGGKKALAPRALSGTSRGTITVNETKSPITNTWTVQGLDQLKWSSEFTLNDNLTTIVMVVDRDKGWISGNNGEAGPLPKALFTPIRHGFAGLRLADSLLPLLGKEWKLSALGELKVDDRPAVGIQATRKGMPTVDLWFDRGTNLLVRGEMRVAESESAEATYKAHFGTYKKIGERKYFTKMTIYRDDKMVLEMERSDLKARDRVDDETFAKP